MAYMILRVASFAVIVLQFFWIVLICLLQSQAKAKLSTVYGWRIAGHTQTFDLFMKVYNP